MLVFIVVLSLSFFFFFKIVPSQAQEHMYQEHKRVFQQFTKVFHGLNSVYSHVVFCFGLFFPIFFSSDNYP